MTGGHVNLDGDAPIATELLYENENCRVWLLDLPARSTTPWHVHECDYVFIVTASAPIQCEFISGREAEEQNDQVGDMLYKVPDPGHRLVNNSSSPYQNVIVELRTQKGRTTQIGAREVKAQ